MNELKELIQTAERMGLEKKAALIEIKEEAFEAIREFAIAADALGYEETYIESETPIINDQYCTTDPYTGLETYEISINFEGKITETKSAIINPNGRLERETYTSVTCELTDRGCVELLQQLPVKLAQHINNQKLFLDLAKSLKK